jgi:hypothetical protein
MLGFIGNNNDIEHGITAEFASRPIIMPGWFRPWPDFVMPI